ncbi:hypothetical protein Airi01_020630 [Actinoallomurus iriomotensis]|uniref:Uncharacterized protein n=1 Tax=Actinoallomurus iriomotensis TaxID=478107 RepID=A0A9W6RDH8_9ACTN|nr:hypothetical protein Airi01_020630 [Actinoallomurus iriomotensis]
MNTGANHPATGPDAPSGPHAEARSSIQAVGPHFVIVSAGGPGEALSTALTALPAVPGALVVLAAAHDAPDVLYDGLGRLSAIAAGRGASALILAASGLAAPIGDRRPAAQVAEAAGLPVIAPDGMVWIEPDGTLRVAGVAEADPASWWRCDPTGPPRRLGPAWPPASAGPAVVPLAGGRWLAADGVPSGAVTDLASAPDGTHLLVVGTPEHPVLTVADLAAALVPGAEEPPGPAVPLDGQAVCLAAPWASPAELTRMGAGLSDLLRTDVRLAVGLPTRTTGGHTCRFLDASGQWPTWEPWLRELTASWRLRQVLPSGWRAWAEPPPGDVGPGVLRVLAGWELEAVPAGLWLRPAKTPAGDSRLHPPDLRRPVLIVGARDRSVPEAVWRELPGVLADLPEAERAHLALVGAFRADPRSEAAARAFAETHALEWAGLDLPAAVPETRAPAVPAPVGQPAAGLDAAASPTVRTESGDGVPDPTLRPARVLRSGVAASEEFQGSTPGDRAAFRALAGEHFLRYASRVDQAIARLPGLRAASGDDRTDLVAVLLYQADVGEPMSRAELVAAARRGDGGPAGAVLACLGSGLRRLPCHRGPVLLGAALERTAFAVYEPGAVVTEPAPVAAITAADADLAAPVEIAVWSSTGRRPAVFAGPGDEPQVVFPPGTRFVLLDTPGPRVLLREMSGAEPDRAQDRKARDRLLAWLERRDATSPEGWRAVGRPGRFHVAPGVPADAEPTG